MVFVPAPETTTRVAFPEARKDFKHFPGSIGLEDDLCGLDRVLLWNVHQEVYVVECEAEVAELEPEAFQAEECLDADVDVDLFSEAVVSVVSDEHHGHPVVAGVTRNLFRATANYILHKDFFSCRVREGQANACRTRQNRVWFSWRKKEMRLFICGSYAVASDRAVFPVATIKSQENKYYFISLCYFITYLYIG